ncbi:MAG: hypothetical protein LBG44_08625 [Gemmatimonadota bacterium]|jgi:hypothetical protein|nr:hypothetical protein [Gemmatimonadota bacterium]
MMGWVPGASAAGEMNLPTFPETRMMSIAHFILVLGLPLVGLIISPTREGACALRVPGN